MSSNMMVGMAFEDTFAYKLIYIMSIDDSQHKGLLKIGEATIKTNSEIDEIKPCCHELNIAAKQRIDSYTKTAAISYNLLYTELAVRKEKTDSGSEVIKSFSDHKVHDVLTNSGFERKEFDDARGKEWFVVDLITARSAIAAVKENRTSISQVKLASKYAPIIFRPEQEAAIEQTIKIFKDRNRMLWNAKMRFGKTLCALEVIKKLQLKKSIIITHRPVVNSGWYEDFKKIFYDQKNYEYGSKQNGQSLEELLNSKKNIVYFASIQDLRGSDAVGGKFSKNDKLFSTKWDFVVVDEAHEGTTTELGNEVILGLVKKDENTKMLELSGTPFNILNEYDTANIFTWDYVMEQRRKLEWDKEHFGDYNPYADLPKMQIYAYDLGEEIKNKSYLALEDKAFNFHEFFRVWSGDIKVDNKRMPKGVEVGDFYHNEDVKSFLNLITKKDNNSHYPYSNDRYRSLFQHTLWMVPGVKAAKALSKLLKSHPVFGSGAFNIVNVAGEGDEEEKSEDALKKVRRAIDSAGENYTITISCGRLTTGVTVPEWTAVFMLAGTFSTSASSYLQTIFRVQSPCNKNGKVKQCCYVFDFAPDRTLKMVAEAAALSTKAGKTTETDKRIMGELLNFCPIIAISGTKMKAFDTNRLLQQLKRAYAERTVQNGFDDTYIYNDELLKLDGIALQEFDNLKKIIGKTKASHKTREINVNEQGFTEEEYEELERITKKPARQRSKEEDEKLQELKAKRKQRDTAISILRGISIRMPLLIYGANFDFEEDITMEKLVDNVDDASWKEFMPDGVSKEIFKKFIKYYDKEVFIAAGHKIRNTVKGADTLLPMERVKQIGMLFSYFKNPDKETVLTPWNVVNIHMSDCLGGYKFFDKKSGELLEEPLFTAKGNVTNDTLLNKDAHILEINSKTGLYPLYIVYSLFRAKCNELKKADLTLGVQERIWNETIQNNMFIICKTQMAKAISIRTLAGYKKANVNAHYFDDLINYLQNKPSKFVNRILKASYWKRGNGEMKFDAIVGNPPYQENISSSAENSSLSKQLFPLFIENAINLRPKYLSLITPSRWFTGEAQDKSFIKLRRFVKEHNHFCEIYHYPDNKLLFKNVLIAGGVNYFLFKDDYVGDVKFAECYEDKTEINNRPLFEDGLDIVLSMNKLIGILDNVRYHEGFEPITKITFGRNAFGITGNEKQLAKITREKSFRGAVEVRCAYENILYTKRENITKNIEAIDKWKIFISKGNGGAGLLSDDKQVTILGRAYIGKPLSVCTDSLIPIGPFDTEEEAVNLQKYMSTKFLRFMVGILKVSQNVYQNVYKFVPIQNFTKSSDIKWSKDIQNIDKQLYSKYGFSKEQVDFIESRVKYF